MHRIPFVQAEEYDGLVEQPGGTDTPGIGFAMGLERLVETMKNSGFKFPTAKTPVIFIGYIGEKAFKVARTIANELRLKGIYCEIDINDRSLKAQLKFADKKDALYSVVLGDAEIDTNKAIIKNMKTQETKEVSIDSIVRRVVENII